MFDPILHPRDASGRFLTSGPRFDRLLAQLERRLATTERRLRQLQRAEARRAGSAGMMLPPRAGPVRGGD
jgi:hypothetical protein